MKPNGPFRCEHLPSLFISHVIGSDRRVVCSSAGRGHKDTARRIAAALNVAETSKPRNAKVPTCPNCLKPMEHDLDHVCCRAVTCSKYRCKRSPRRAEKGGR